MLEEFYFGCRLSANVAAQSIRQFNRMEVELSNTLPMVSNHICCLAYACSQKFTTLNVLSQPPFESLIDARECRTQLEIDEDGRNQMVNCIVNDVMIGGKNK
jgi:hypothetical protein